MANNVAERAKTALVVRGSLAIVFGIAALFWPGLTLVTLAYIFSAYILISGLVGIVLSIAGMRRLQYWWLDLILSFVELGIGVYLIRHIHVTLATFLLLAGIVLVVRGVVELVQSVFQKDADGNRILTALAGALALLAGIVVLLYPVSSGLAFVWVLGLYALLTGPLLLALASEIDTN